MHQRYSHSGGHDRRTNHHIDHLQERDKNGQFSKPQSIDHAKERRNVGQETQSCTTIATHQRVNPIVWSKPR